ncbi:MAG TPA: DNA repair protein RadC [Polyangiaceae bacterium]|nr:DNA repair protein RadC [Polyangiaceae bacterium]
MADTVGPRDRALSNGLGSLADVDLVALLVGHGVRGRPVMRVAEQVLEYAGGLEGLARAGPALLGDMPGMGSAKALRLAAAFELGRRLQARLAAPREPVGSPAEVAACFAPRIGGLDHEQMWVLSLDGRNRLRGSRRVAQGGAHGLAVSAREILGAALSDGASGFVLVHNHPSGSPEPSDEDVSMTAIVAEAADIVGVPLLDHVVVTASGAYTSMLDEGLLC